MHFRAVERTGVILIVDDEPIVGDLMVRMLAAEGYQGHSARETNGALAFFRCDPESVCCVVLDQSMDGSESFYAALRAERPALPVIATSGYSSQFLSSRFPGLSPEAFLQKPFLKRDLIGVLSRWLGPIGETEATQAQD